MNPLTANHLASAIPARSGRKLPLQFLVRAAGYFLLAIVARGDEAPDPQAILKTVRLAQSAQSSSLTGAIRNAGKSLPFRLISAKGTIRYEFTEPAQVIQLRLGEKDARLEEITGGKSEKITARRFDDRVRETDISYEDLSLGFLYWPQATVRGEQTMLLQKCWIIRVEPGSRGDSQYGKVDLWISKKTGALMQAEAFNPAGKLARKFKVISGQPVGDGLWILKEMRIESFSGRPEDRTPTYLDIEKPGN